MVTVSYAVPRVNATNESEFCCDRAVRRASCCTRCSGFGRVARVHAGQPVMVIVKHNVHRWRDGVVRRIRSRRGTTPPHKP